MGERDDNGSGGIASERIGAAKGRLDGFGYEEFQALDAEVAKLFYDSVMRDEFGGPPQEGDAGTGAGGPGGEPGRGPGR